MRGQVFDTVLQRAATPRRVPTLTPFARWKGIVLVAMGALGSLNLHGQGLVSLANSASSGVSYCYGLGYPPVYTCEAAQVGTRFSIGLYYAPDGVHPFLLLQPTTSISPLAGRFYGGTRTTPALTPPGGYAMFQVKVWETAFGSTFEEALNAPPQNGTQSRLGISRLMRVRTGTMSGSLLPLGPIEVNLYPSCLSPGLPSPFILGPSSVSNLLGTSVYLEASPGPYDCEIDSWQWYLNGVGISGAFMPELFIPRVQFADAGVYSVNGRIGESYGYRSAGVALTVLAGLTLASSGSGTVQAEPNQPTYLPHANVVITATPAAGHELLKWSGDANGHTNPLVVFMDMNKTITAHFALKPRLEILGPSPTRDERLRLTGETGVIYTIQQSENLEVWEPFLTVTNVTSTVDFDGPAITNRSRFFKAIRFP